MSGVLDGEWVLYSRMSKHYPGMREYFIASVKTYNSHDPYAGDGYERTELCRGTESEVRKMWNFATKANREVT